MKKLSTNSWTCYVLADASEVNDGVSVNSAGKKQRLDQKVKPSCCIPWKWDLTPMVHLTNYTPTRNPTTDWKFIGAEDSPTLSFNFGLDANGDETTGAVTQLASVSTVTSLDQNGYGVGNLTSVTVKSDGSVVGLYDNGQDMIMGQVSIAIFDSPTGLERMGGNIYRATPIRRTFLRTSR